jgi:guanylate kinase
LEVLHERLKDRGTESEESLSRRLYKAKFESTFQDKFDVIILNDEKEKSFAEAEKLVGDFLAK